jgi:hypothetical protein
MIKPGSPQWRPLPSAWKTRKLAMLAAALVFGLTLLAFHTDVASSALPSTSIFKADPCRGWDPHAPEEFDPPACVRAQQFRQIARFTATPEYVTPIPR